jgi:hypothetical protein
MQSVYHDIQKRAAKIALEFPPPDFYRDFQHFYETSRMFYETDPIIARLKVFVAGHIENDFGHGMNHVIKVTIDAGTLMIIEAKRKGYPENVINRRMLIVQCAGLLHDIERKKKEHAICGSEFANDLLRSYPLEPNEVEDIRLSIRNHEAFKTVEKIDAPESQLVSDCLYDADKFRWGPDNFTETVWDMVAFAGTPIEKFIDHYPRGVEGLARIKDTFRTPTGKKYGPQFIDLGIDIGRVIYDYLKDRFKPEG